MDAIRPLFSIQDPDSRTCGSCGEGQLHFGVRATPQTSSRFVFHCTACTFEAPLEG